jgi:hypothetical protein
MASVAKSESATAGLKFGAVVRTFGRNPINEMATPKIQINRAPVLTLWASVVAERLGFAHDEALSLGKAVAGLTAQSKGRRLGIYKPVPTEIKKARAEKRGEEFWVEICGRPVPAINTRRRQSGGYGAGRS